MKKWKLGKPPHHLVVLVEHSWKYSLFYKIEINADIFFIKIEKTSLNSMTQYNFSHKTQQTGSIFQVAQKTQWAITDFKTSAFHLLGYTKDLFGGTYLLFVLSALAIRFELSMVEEGKGDRWSAGDNWNRSSWMNMERPWLKMCQSLRRTQDSWKKQK